MLKIAIIDFGNSAQFLAKTLLNQGHTILAHSPHQSPCGHSNAAQHLGIPFFSDLRHLCHQNPDVIFLFTSTTLTSAHRLLKSLALHPLGPNTLIVDLLPVKQFSKSLLLNCLPPNYESDVVSASLVLGPTGPIFAYDKARIGSHGVSWCEEMLSILERGGFGTVKMSCAEQDKWAAVSQFVTLTVGRVLGALKLESTPINTKGYEALLGLVGETAAAGDGVGDGFDLYHEVFVYNESALEMLERLDLAFEALKNQLFGYLHEFVMKQLRVATLEEDQNGGAALVYATKTTRSQNAAPPQDHKAQISDRFVDNSRLKIAIVGFGNFGQFLAKTMVHQGHTVLAYSRSDYSDVALKLGVSYFPNAADLFENHPEVILICTSILSTEKVLRSLPVQRLKRNTLFVDVLSVKEFPRNLLLQNLPLDCDILCTHPMFGPESGKNGWKGLPFVFDKVRVGHDESRVSRCNQFLDIFAQEGCEMVEMSCAEHDKHAAASQFITHTVGRVLEKLGLKSTPIDTKGYQTLLSLVKNTAGDSFDLYYGLFMHNMNAMVQLKRLDQAFESLKKQVFRRLHGTLRKQIFENADSSQVMQEKPLFPTPSQNASALGR